MKTLTMFKGLPGSGKDFKAKQIMDNCPHKYKRVNKDDLRAMLDHSNHTKSNEKFVLKVRDFIITEALQDGKNVLCTDTNLNSVHETRLRQLARENNASFLIEDLTNVDIETCIKNDLNRNKSVGEKVIRDMYKEYLKPKKERVIYPYLEGLQDCVICDLDGTLALFDGNPYERDFENDTLNFPVWRMLYSLSMHTYKDTEIKLIILSGRTDVFEDVTREWLKRKGVESLSYELHMRKNGDMRKDAIVKEKMFYEYIKGKYNPIAVFDDRNSVVELWRSMGLPVFQVADGDF